MYMCNTPVHRLVQWHLTHQSTCTRVNITAGEHTDRIHCSWIKEYSRAKNTGNAMSGFVYTQYPVVGTHRHSPAYKLFYTGIIEVVLFSWCVKNIVVCESLVLSKDDLRLVRRAECAHPTHINLLPCILRTYPKWVFEYVWVCECVYVCQCVRVYVCT